VIGPGSMPTAKPRARRVWPVPDPTTIGLGNVLGLGRDRFGASLGMLSLTLVKPKR